VRSSAARILGAEIAGSQRRLDFANKRPLSFIEQVETTGGLFPCSGTVQLPGVLTLEDVDLTRRQVVELQNELRATSWHG
jgi:hypothetical protein